MSRRLIPLADRLNRDLIPGRHIERLTEMTIGEYFTGFDEILEEVLFIGNGMDIGITKDSFLWEVNKLITPYLYRDNIFSTKHEVPVYVDDDDNETILEDEGKDPTTKIDYELMNLLVYLIYPLLYKEKNNVFFSMPLRNYKDFMIANLPESSKANISDFNDFIVREYIDKFPIRIAARFCLRPADEAVRYNKLRHFTINLFDTLYEYNKYKNERL